VERLIRDANRASEVLARIRAMAKKADPRKTWLDVNEVIREIFALVQSEARRNAVTIRVVASPSSSRVFGDRVQLQQVVLNLAVNAIESMISVTERSRAMVLRSQPHEGNGLLVAVEDSGVGLDPRTRDRLFDAFFTTKPGGLGMGLSISRSIIEAHGGRLWASSNAGPGATFQFTLPSGGTGA
jgi:signal transduction histidine kinase